MSVSTWTTNPYPRPRKDRRGAEVNLDAQGQTVEIPLPGTFLWHVHLRGTTVNARNSVASRKVLGPAVVRAISGVFTMVGANFNTLCVAGLYYQTTPYAAVSGQTPTLTPTGQPLFETQLGGEQKYSAPNAHGFSHSPDSTSVSAISYPVGRFLRDPELYLTMFLDMRAAAGEVDLGATVQIFEHVDLADVVALLT